MKALDSSFIIALLFSVLAATVNFGITQASRDISDIPIPTPSVPEFTVKLISSLSEANKTGIGLTIKNQPFDENNIYNYSFVYNVRIRSNEENWTDLYDAEDGYPTRSDSDYTVLLYVLGESAYYPPADYPLSPSMRVGVLPTIGQVDFQVEAMIGYRDRGDFSVWMMPYLFYGERSGWSNAQTLSISEVQTPTPEPEPFPRTIGVASIVIIAIVTVIGTGILVYFKNKKHTKRNWIGVESHASGDFTPRFYY